MILCAIWVFHLLLWCFIVSVNSSSDVKLKKIASDDMYELMKEAYYDEDWEACVKYGLTTVAHFKNYARKLVDCRYNCKTAKLTRSEDAFFILYGASLSQITCIDKCKQSLPGVKNNNLKYFSNYLEREPYDFIQICYYKLGEYTKGAAAAATFLVANPAHSYMKNNINNYKTQLHVNEADMVDLEAGEYQALYKHGLDLYEEGKWLEQAKNMADALDNYHLSYNNCSLLCEAGYEAYTSDHDRNHEAVGAVADQVERIVKCKHKCKAQLSKIGLRPMNDILANVYHHLQYSYSKVGDFTRGAGYAAAFLLHYPNDADMINNKKYLINEQNVSEDLFTAPEREKSMKMRLDELESLMRYLNTDYISQHSDGRPEMDRAQQLEGFLGGAIKVNKTGEKLGGAERVVADGFATQQQCDLLIDLCKVFGSKGDGYGGASGPSDHEAFEGLTVKSSAEQRGIAGHKMGGTPTPFTEHEVVYGIGVNETGDLVEEGKLSSSLLDLYLDLSEQTRKYTQLYFNLHELYFDFTHLVCRIAIHENATRDDLSHPIHSDNCIIQDDGSCYKGPPAFTQRDYSGLLYLNDNFEGGQFFFADNHLHEQASVQPKCGRLVAFNAGDYHGVKAVQSGRRCAIAVWFTLDSDYNEVSRMSALNMLRTKHGSRQRDEL